MSLTKEFIREEIKAAISESVSNRYNQQILTEGFGDKVKNFFMNGYKYVSFVFLKNDKNSDTVTIQKNQDGTFTATGVFSGKPKFLGNFRSKDELVGLMRTYRDDGFYVATSNQTISGSMMTIAKVVAVAPLTALSYGIVGIGATAMVANGIEVPSWLLKLFPYNVYDLPSQIGSTDYVKELLANKVNVNYSKVAAPDLIALAKVGVDVPRDALVKVAMSPYLSSTQIADMAKVLSPSEIHQVMSSGSLTVANAAEFTKAVTQGMYTKVVDAPSELMQAAQRAAKSVIDNAVGTLFDKGILTADRVHAAVDAVDSAKNYTKGVLDTTINKITPEFPEFTAEQKAYATGIKNTIASDAAHLGRMFANYFGMAGK